MPSEDELEWVTVADFTAGIWSGHFGTDGQPAKDGAALDTTYGCVGHPSGGLVPGPRLTRSFYENYPTAGFTGSGEYVFGGPLVVTGFGNISPVKFDSQKADFLPTESTEPYGDPPDFAFVTFSGYALQTDEYGGAFGVGYKFFLEEVASIVTSLVKWTQKVSTSATQPQRVYGPGGVAMGRTARTSGEEFDPGFLSVALLLGSPFAPHVHFYPSQLPTAPNVAGATDPSAVDSFVNHTIQNDSNDGPRAQAPILSHQGRLMYGAYNLRTAATAGSLLRIGSGVSIATSERFAYTPVNFWYDSVAPTEAVFVEDRPFGVGAAISMNANTLFVVKTNGGAYAVTGSLDSPTIIRLPGVASTGIARNVPCATPLGVVYGSPRGVWLWRGGADTSLNIAPQLDGWFWKPEAADGTYPGVADQINGEVGSFGYQEPFVFAPNNWLWDMRTKSWWRFGNPNERTYAWNSPSASGEMLCAVPYLYPGTPSQPFIDWFDPAQGTSHYHFDGQPLQRTRGRQLTFRAIRIVAQGEGSLKITLTSVSGDTAEEDFFLRPDSPLPHVIEKSIDLTGQDCTYSIDAAGRDFNSEAPTLYRVEFGYALTGGQVNTGE